MKRPVSLFTVLALMTLLAACQSSTGVEQPAIHSTTLSVTSLPKVFDESRMFHYKYAQVNSDSVLMELWLAGIPVVQGWLPLDNHCMDPIGPRFTVELAKPLDAILKFDFENGSGRLMCATKVRRYIVVPR
ncbi:MAG: hypothetical protein C4326_12235 [Ignavibacteria bacterium]